MVLVVVEQGRLQVVAVEQGRLQVVGQGHQVEQGKLQVVAVGESYLVEPYLVEPFLVVAVELVVLRGQTLVVVEPLGLVGTL